MDKGPWEIRKVLDRAVFLESDDFDHDVSLKIIGDFEDEEGQNEYAQWLCDILNKACMENKMTVAEAVEECQLWWAHLAKAKARAEEIQRLAALAKTGEKGQKTAQERLRQIDSEGLTVFDASKLEKATRFLVEAARRNDY